MFSLTRKSIFIAAVTLWIAISGHIQAQNKFDPKLLTPGRNTLACYTVKNGKESPIGTLTFGLHTAGDKLTVTTITAFTGMEEWTDTAVSTLSSFKPIYRASHNYMRDMVLNFGKDITGYHVDKKTGRESEIKEAGNRSFVDSYTYPFILSLLPLSSGYQTDFQVYDYKPSNTDNVKTAVVKEVKTSTFISKSTGNHDVWEVTVHEPTTGEKSVSYIDKKTRRLWQVDIFSKGLQVRMIDMETDFNSIKAPFDKAATMQMVNEGSATISGQVFARDHNDNIWSKMELVNWEAKQAAARGTLVYLIPYTDYFREWVKVNEAQQKKGRDAIFLSDDAAQCIKSATIYDDAGHFEFVNLQPGEYLLYTAFSFANTRSYTEVTGYTDHYVNGIRQGTTEHTREIKYKVDKEVLVKKVVTISKPGEKVTVKLKKTR
ncbi:hypothetical protein [Chitinophaga varians]|uniref:DUF3108 domain-containing protein n=1 Tax=Chitinophaga varians TaxID=2202339 RepID=UPI00165EE066|nr:hypothetical protein [Chitinophaga varians]MBC9911047.1 hypothetical protein [Chitinophaga varians]